MERVIRPDSFWRELAPKIEEAKKKGVSQDSFLRSQGLNPSVYWSARKRLGIPVAKHGGSSSKYPKSKTGFVKLVPEGLSPTITIELTVGTQVFKVSFTTAELAAAFIKLWGELT